MSTKFLKKNGTNAGQSLILVVCTLLGYGVHMLIVLKAQEDRADENINLKEFFGYNGKLDNYTKKIIIKNWR